MGLVLVVLVTTSATSSTSCISSTRSISTTSSIVVQYTDCIDLGWFDLLITISGSRHQPQFLTIWKGFEVDYLQCHICKAIQRKTNLIKRHYPRMHPEVEKIEPTEIIYPQESYDALDVILKMKSKRILKN